MRAPTNNTCDIYWGPLKADPGGLRAADVECRLVPDVVFRELDAPYTELVAYLTIPDSEMTVPNGPRWTMVESGEWTAEWGYADRIVIASITDLEFIVARVEYADPTSGGPYYRVHLSLDNDLDEPGGGGGGGGGEVGSDLYYASPWGLLLWRSGPKTWSDATADTILTTDGEGSWSCVDVADDITYETSGWDGSGTRRLYRDGDPESSDWVDMQQGE